MGLARSEVRRINGEFLVEAVRFNRQVADYRKRRKGLELHDFAEIGQACHASEHPLTVCDHSARTARTVMAGMPVEKARVFIATDRLQGIQYRRIPAGLNVE